jgi:hypothetical protein
MDFKYHRNILVSNHLKYLDSHDSFVNKRLSQVDNKKNGTLYKKNIANLRKLSVIT